MLTEGDILQEPLALHDQIGHLQRMAKARGVDVHAELRNVAQRLPRHYASVGVRVYHPMTAKWKLQVLEAVMISMTVFLVILFFSTVAVYWSHVESVGVDQFVNAYLINTLLIQAFACEFREIFNILFANILLKELLMILCCLPCVSAVDRTASASRRAGQARRSSAKRPPRPPRPCAGLSTQVSRISIVDTVRRLSSAMFDAPPPRLLSPMPSQCSSPSSARSRSTASRSRSCARRSAL